MPLPKTSHKMKHTNKITPSILLVATDIGTSNKLRHMTKTIIPNMIADNVSIVLF